MPSRIGPKKGEGDAAAEDEPPASPSLAKRLTSRISTKAGTATLACGPARYQLSKAGTVITAFFTSLPM